MKTIQKLSAVLAIIAIAYSASFANAQVSSGPSTPTDSDSAVKYGGSAADAARATEAANTRLGSPPVNRAARPADPIPRANTTAERAQRFADQEREWQQLSTP